MRFAFEFPQLLAIVHYFGVQTNIGVQLPISAEAKELLDLNRP